MHFAQAFSREGVLADDEVQQTIEEGLAGRFRNQRVLVLIPDRTRSVPLPLLFRAVTEALHDTRQLDFMVALGTHQPLPEDALLELVGISPQERHGAYRHVGLLNHAWDDGRALVEIARLGVDEVKGIAGDLWHPSLGGDVTVRINRAALEHDHILIIGPTFPHEVVGFSGGAKYLFPGISGPEMINVTHWLGALMTVLNTIGVEDTPVRAMINAAADHVPTPVTLCAPVVVDGRIAGLFIGDARAAHHASVELSAARHIVWLDRPFKRVLSHAPQMYDELWTAAKAMYKLDPGMEDGGEVVVYAPHLGSISQAHGVHIRRVGYHVRDYFLKQWERFESVPLGVLAHSTHLKGSGTYVDGREHPRIRVTLASQIPQDICEAVNLGYADPRSIDIEAWRGREDEGMVYIPRAGETLFRVKES